MKNIVLFASGTGTNAENILVNFSGHPQINVAAIFCNNPVAGVVQVAQKHNIPIEIFNREELHNGTVNTKLSVYDPALIVLAGFLLMFPQDIIENYPNKIINLHPALLPKYGGKGMYGMNVHRSVIENNERETGITIHYIDANYDEGEIIFQKAVALAATETCEDVSAKVRELEHQYFPEVIRQILS